MKTGYSFVFLMLISTQFVFGQFVEHTRVYGQVETDINRGYRIRLMPDGNFMLAGQWNNQAYLTKVDCEGNTLATQFFGDVIGGTSSFDDVQQLPDSSWVAVGTCEFCVPGDTTAKVVLLKVDADLNYDKATGVTILGKSARYPQFPASTQDSPQLLVDGTTLVLVAQYGNIGALNNSDFLLTKLDFDLDTVSTKLFHHQFFDLPVAIFKNPAGYLVVANHAFVSGAATIQTDLLGNVLWTNIGISDITAYAARMLPNGNVLVCGVKSNNGGWLGEFGGTDGVFTGNELILGGERATDLQVLPNDNVLLTAWFPLATGARSTRIYRLQTNPLQVAGTYDLVPNPDIFTNMGSHSIVPLSDDGTSFATTGVRGFYNRTFFHTKRDCSALTAPGHFAATLCPGESIQIGNIIFNENNPTGSAILPDVAVCGCDSTVEVSLNFWPPAESAIAFTFCPGASLELDGMVFDEENPKGDIFYPGQSANGCDSVLHIELTFFPVSESNFIQTYCPGVSVNIGGELFNEARASGDVVFPGQSVLGCDSTVHVSLSFYPAAESDLTPTLCPGGSILVAGQTFDAGNPAGDVLLAGQSANGCDSTIHVFVSFYPAAESDLTPNLCPGGSITVAGQTFDAGNPAGDVVLAGQSANGCDSTVHVFVSFYPAAESDLTPNLCPGGSITVAGQTFDAGNPAGDVLLAGQSANGCDSTVHVSVSFYPAVESDYSPILCHGGSVLVGDQTFDAGNLAGDVVLAGQSANGCDSAVHVSVSFYPAVESDYTPTLCHGGSVMVGDQTFDAGNPAGDVVLAGQSANGCDSTVHVSVSFYPQAMGFVTDTLITGDSLVVGDHVFNIGNPSGTVVLLNASYTGCDSTVTVDLKFVTGVAYRPFAAGTFDLFPNPVAAGNPVLLQYDFTTGKRLQIACFGVAGNLIWEKSSVLLEPKGILALATSETAGAYWLSVRDLDGYFAHFRFVVF